MIGLHAIVIYGTLALCAVGVVAALRRYDMSPREPWHAVIFAIIVGCAMMLGAMRAQDAVIFKAPDILADSHSNVRFAFVAASVEELAKLFSVGIVALCFRKYFEEESDGVVYGGLVGLGAALCESVHVLGLPRGSILLPIEEPIRIAGHLIMGSISCSGLGFWAVGRRGWWWGIPLCFTLGSGLHFLWDVVAYETADQFKETGRVLWSQHVAAAGLMVTGMVMFRAILLRVGVRVRD